MPMREPPYGDALFDQADCGTPAGSELLYVVELPGRAYGGATAVLLIRCLAK